MENLGDIFPAGEQFKVVTPGGRVAMIFSNVSESVPLPVIVRCGGAHGIIRFAGGTGGITDANQRALLNHARQAFDSGLEDVVLMSGGTRVLGDDDAVVMTILELPSLVRQWNPTCRTLGSVPRTRETASLMGAHSTFIPGDRVDDVKTLVHPGLDAFWFVQLSASQTADDHKLDIPLYFDLLDLMREENSATGLWVWGGGTVTAEEIREAIDREHPCGVVRGSGRFADALIDWIEGRAVSNRAFAAIIQRWQDQGVSISDVDILSTPDDTQRWLRRYGFYAA